jgi:hypothetical protein
VFRVLTIFDFHPYPIHNCVNAPNTYHMNQNVTAEKALDDVKRFTLVPLTSVSDQVSVRNTALVMRLTDFNVFEKNHPDSIGMLGLHSGGNTRTVHIGLCDHLNSVRNEGIELIRKLRSLSLPVKSVTGLCVGDTPVDITKIAHLKNSDMHVLIRESRLPKQYHANFLLGIVTKDSTGTSISDEEFWNLSDMVSKTLQKCFPEVIIC